MPNFKTIVEIFFSAPLRKKTFEKKEIVVLIIKVFYGDRNFLCYLHNNRLSLFNFVNLILKNSF